MEVSYKKKMMKKISYIVHLLSWILVFSSIGCSKSPQVLSANNFTMLSDSERAKIGVTKLPIPEVRGTWKGLEHKIEIELTNGINELTLFSANLIDTLHSRDSGNIIFDIHFMAIEGSPYMEVIDWGVLDQHNFNMALTTYLKVNKLTADTIIVQLLNSNVTEGWLKKRGYTFFVKADEKKSQDHTIYLTDDLDRLARLLKELYSEPNAFQLADTIVRTGPPLPSIRSIKWGNQK
jgi:hypothetical protein